jgi:hypothetical protein
VQEEGKPWMDHDHRRVRGTAPAAISRAEEHGGCTWTWNWPETEGVTELRFTQHLTGTDGVGEVGPGGSSTWTRW